jgi:uncharacterized protein with NRDE domain
LPADAHEYGAANLFVGDSESLWHWSNRGEVAHPIAPGLYGLSNGLLEDDWPKMRRGRERLEQLVAASALDEDALFALLADRTASPDHELPDTGVGLDLERKLSPIFIAGDEYGTRASTVLLVTHDGHGRMHERRWAAHGVPDGETMLELR